MGAKVKKNLSEIKPPVAESKISSTISSRIQINYLAGFVWRKKNDMSCSWILFQLQRLCRRIPKCFSWQQICWKQDWSWCRGCVQNRKAIRTLFSHSYGFWSWKKKQIGGNYPRFPFTYRPGFSIRLNWTTSIRF